VLPFLKSKKDGGNTGLIVKTRAPDQTQETDEDDPSQGHIACAHALMDAIKANDAQGVSDALYDAFTLMEVQPHEESSHSKHDYDSQNERAAKDND